MKDKEFYVGEIKDLKVVKSDNGTINKIWVTVVTRGVESKILIDAFRW